MITFCYDFEFIFTNCVFSFFAVVAVIIGVILYCSIVLLSNRVDKTQLTLFDEVGLRTIII